ncbi:MAG: 50S ribosome-binding GTPase [Nanoarchaeota archaeon]|nr:50S ribosome-binding GTPase [Nanoarchaeota archaeon]
MSSTNQGPEYFAAEKKYLYSQNVEEKVFWLEEMIRSFKKHKGSEKMLAELKTRLNKLREKIEKGKKVGKGRKGIRKEGYQVCLVGKTNSGKSSLLSRITNASPKISGNKFTTAQAELGTMDYEGVRAQIVDLPPLKSKELDYSLVNTADCLLLVVEKLNELDEINNYIIKALGKKIVVVNKVDKLNEKEKRKLEESCRSERLNYVLISCVSREGINELKKKIFKEMDVIRVYTKEPGKEKSEKPIILPSGSNVRDVAESIYKGFSKQINETRLTGPSGKFSNQKVGLKHRLKDKDVVEFHGK